MTSIRMKNSPELASKCLTLEAGTEALEEFRMRYEGSEPEPVDAESQMNDRLAVMKPNSFVLKRLRRVLAKF